MYSFYGQSANLHLCCTQAFWDTLLYVCKWNYIQESKYGMISRYDVMWTSIANISQHFLIITSANICNHNHHFPPLVTESGVSDVWVLRIWGMLRGWREHKRMMDALNVNKLLLSESCDSTAWNRLNLISICILKRIWFLVYVSLSLCHAVRYQRENSPWINVILVIHPHIRHAWP